jgi:hypothetical protein
MLHLVLRVSNVKEVTRMGLWAPKSLQNHHCDEFLLVLKVKKGVEPQFFGFRWITLLLSQEFLLPELMRIWDSLFADANRFDFLLYMCCSMIITVREKLIAGDFAEAVKLLQHYPPSDIHKLLCNAEEIRRFHPLKKR